ncbi:MAG TPA: DarT ssDNA thymidine ADP-ribosyltransferase family protein [Polyangia bacterium]|nr:DarT ssDNA thymidine ADP-ribosyltransferase family protein [Polyangia bacterium]
MSPVKKADAAQILDHLAALKTAPWLGPARAWWPDCLFRVDGMEATARILNSGALLSRATATAEGVLLSDAASPQVIAATSERWKNYVRLYFRPRTPTQFHSEGFRRTDEYGLGARCPAPVVMVFDSRQILVRSDALFSDGNLAANASTGGDAAFLRGIPFERVYHDSWFEQADRKTIVFNRHAEVIIPDRMSLDALRFIGCRSQAEYETLIFLLDITARKNWSNKIGLSVKANLHNRHWSFVEQAVLEAHQVKFRFNPSTKTPGPFNIRMDVIEHAGKRHYWESASYLANSELSVRLGSMSEPGPYTATLRIEGDLAYASRYQATDMLL